MTYTHPCFAAEDVLDCDGHCDTEYGVEARTAMPERWEKCAYGQKHPRFKDYEKGGKLF